MRKTLFFLSSSLFLSALFYSCKKDEANTTSLQSEITSQTAASRINNNVIDWLDNQKAMSKPKLKEHLELLMTNLEFSRAKTEEFNNVDDFIAIPLNKNYNRIKNIDERSRINLVVFADKSGEIKGARIIELIPEQGNDLTEYPSDVFKKVVNKQFPGANGTVKLSGLDGLLSREVTYKSGKLFSSGVVQQGDKKIASSRMAEEVECTDWYLYETWYDEYGNVIDWELTYLYTTCEDGGGGGGGYNPGQCSMTHEEAQAALASVSMEIESCGVSTIGSETVPDTDGIIKAAIVVKRDQLRLHWIPGISSSVYSLQFPGVAFKTTNSVIWKWESLNWGQIVHTEGQAPPCMSASITGTGSVAISQDKTSAPFNVEISGTVNISCLFGLEVGNINKTFSGTYVACHFFNCV